MGQIPDGGMDNRHDWNQDMDGYRAARAWAAGTDALWDKCPTCRPGQIADMYASLRQKGYIEPELFNEISTSYYKIGEDTHQEYDPETRTAYNWDVDVYTPVQTKMISVSGENDWSVGGFYEGAIVGGEILREGIEQNLNDLADGKFREVAERLNPLQRCDDCPSGFQFSLPKNSFQAGELAFALASAIITKRPTTGWVKRKVFNSLDPAIKKKVQSAILSGVVGPVGKQGIIKLTKTEAVTTGYTHKIKILGKGGDIRIYGRELSNGHIYFDKVMGH